VTARAPDWTDIAAEKAAWRRRIRAARRARDPEVRARHAELLTEAALELAGEIGGPICAHLPVGVEPWSPSGVEALHAAGHEVLLPVVTDPVGPEHLFVYWYLHRFAGQWPFVRTTTEPALRERFPRVLCPLSGCRSLAQTS